jgi:hypothetical protein
MELVTLRRLAFTNGETCHPAEVSLANHNRLSSSAPFDELAARTDFDIETGELPAAELDARPRPSDPAAIKAGVFATD